MPSSCYPPIWHNGRGTSARWAAVGCCFAEKTARIDERKDAWSSRLTDSRKSTPDFEYRHGSKWPDAVTRSFEQLEHGGAVALRISPSLRSPREGMW